MSDIELNENRERNAGNRWIRILLVLLFAIIYQVSEVVFAAVTLFQVFCMALTNHRNERLNEFADSLTDYMYRVLRYVCLHSDEPPWPLDAPEAVENQG